MFSCLDTGFCRAPSCDLLKFVRFCFLSQTSADHRKGRFIYIYVFYLLSYSLSYSLLYLLFCLLFYLLFYLLCYYFSPTYVVAEYYAAWAKRRSEHNQASNVQIELLNRDIESLEEREGHHSSFFEDLLDQWGVLEEGAESE